MSELRGIGYTMLVLGVLLAGCRTYGDYGAEEALQAQILVANQVFQEELQRAQTDLVALERSAAAQPQLVEPAVAFAGVVAAHELLLLNHAALAEEAAEDDDYRTLHRTYGAIITDQQVIRDQYAFLLAALSDTVAATPAEVPPPKDRYYVVPPYYERIRTANYRLSVTERLRLLEQATGYVDPGQGLAPQPPAADSLAVRQ